MGGALLALSLVGWLLAMASAVDAASLRMPLLALGSTAAFAVGAVAAAHNGWIVPAIVVAATGVFAVVRGEVLVGGPLDVPDF